MRFALDIHHFVTWQVAGTRLQVLLQACFWIFIGVDQGQGLEFASQPGQYAITGSFHARVEVDGANQRFKGVCQDRLATKTAAFQFARTQAQVLLQQLESISSH